MFAAYQIKDVTIDDLKPFLAPGKEVVTESYDPERDPVTTALRRFIDPDGSVDAAAMMGDWFPTEIKADVFISHARADRALAERLAAWLRSMGLEPFLDFRVWSHADGLQRKMDDTWCYNAESRTYSYKKRNLTTSHVHMMLATALTKMMDRCECVFFLNTGNSTSPRNPEQMTGPGESTHSPWLFHEISMLKLLRRREPGRQREVQESFANKRGGETKKVPDFRYPADLDHVPVLRGDKLEQWRGSKLVGKAHILDKLYALEAP